MSGFDQGFTKPNRNAASWDSDLNANFTLLERGYVIPFIVGSASVNTGQLISVTSAGVNSYGVGVFHSPATNFQPPDLIALQAGSPGNTVYGVALGGVTEFPAYSGQLNAGAIFFSSVQTLGWVTSCLDHSNMQQIGRCIKDGQYFLQVTQRLPFPFSRTNSGFAHCASGILGVFSFEVSVGRIGYNSLVRVRALSCDNYRVTFFSSSARGLASIIYDTVINSGNLGVRTIDMIDAAMWTYSLGEVAYPMFGMLHGQVEVLSSAATAINSAAFQVNFGGVRFA